ncbi:hypothetical protein EYF80_020853 [Liparis tanakae]|uniref:Uncharacterized protein n=1 Tax=Liparis tanakae TaxID=230148 RepID=A0A4Z2HVR3_9TELE|nr:hypothetical protein EYF80_020853 [Liparis tanakae]
MLWDRKLRLCADFMATIASCRNAELTDECVRAHVRVQRERERERDYNNMEGLEGREFNDECASTEP